MHPGIGAGGFSDTGGVGPGTSDEAGVVLALVGAGTGAMTGAWGGVGYAGAGGDVSSIGSCLARGRRCP